MKCHECIEQLSAYRDHMLTPKEQKEIEVHLESCLSCNEEMQFLTRMLNELNTMQEVEVPEIVHGSVMKRIFKDKEEAKKRKAVKTWMSYIASTAAVLLIVVALLEGSDILNYKKSNSLYTESAPREAVQDNSSFSDEPIMGQSNMADDADYKNEEIQPFMYKAENGELSKERTEFTIGVAEVWEVTSSERVKVIERIREYSETYERLAQYFPDEDSPTTIILYGVRDKDELFQTINEIDRDLIITKEELEGEILEIIIKE